jgi:hypothetical protein
VRHICGVQVSVGLSGYVLAAPWSGATANYSYPLYADVGASVQDHFLNWKVKILPTKVFFATLSTETMMHWVSLGSGVSNKGGGLWQPLLQLICREQGVMFY